MRESTIKLGGEIMKLLQVMDLADTIHEGTALYAEKGDRQALTFLQSAVHAVETVVTGLEGAEVQKIRQASQDFLKKKEFLTGGGVELNFCLPRETGRRYLCRKLSVCCIKG